MKKKLIGVVAAATFAVCGLSIPSHAASFKIGDVDWNLGGSIRLDSCYRLQDKGDIDETKYTEDSKTDFSLFMPDNNRFKIKADYQDMTGYVELGLDSAAGVKLRHAYAKYATTDTSSLLIGQTDSIVSKPSAGQVLQADGFKGELKGAGNFYLGRNPQIAFSKKSDDLTFEIAIEELKANGDPYGLKSIYETNQMIPEILASVTYKNKDMWITPSALLQSYKLTANYVGPHADYTGEAKDVTVNTWALALNGGVNIEKTKIEYETWYGQNLYIVSKDIERRSGASTKLGMPVAEKSGGKLTGDLKDVNSFGGYAQVSVPVEDLIFCLGAGYQQSDVEVADPADVSKYEDTVSTLGVYANVKKELVKNFFIQPEIAYYDWGKDAKKDLIATGKNDLGSDIYAGIHFQYDI